MPTLDDLVENFELLDDWEDRYRYVIELGKELEPLDPADHSDATKVEGCVSQVWLRADLDETRDVLVFRGDSDSHLVRGLVAILLALYSGRTRAEILEIDAQGALARLGLTEHLTPQRSNGLASMVRYVQAYARGERPVHGRVH
ncbi:MAG: SufE family protein [Alphaproteobacteria bacterium]|nr:SufE family protein [Alphaproteobacteria bacterium]MDX5368508.1 SufE family protein [Alphaproteobacteria bacterium]MDX5463272.1 SufE family protein [Alphaproteobacteria bacterium]